MSKPCATAAAVLSLVAWSAGAAPRDLDEVPVAHVGETTRAIWEAVEGAGVAPHGTVYANVTLDDAGRPTLGDLFGTLQSNEPSLAIVRRVMPGVRFAVPAGWATRNPSRRWVVFWIFQNAGCRDRVFDVPRDVTIVRVCLDVSGEREARETPSVRFEPNLEFAPAVMPESVFCSYPLDSRRIGEQGTTAVLLRVDGTGTARALRLIQSSGYARLDDATTKCVERFRYVPWAGTPEHDGYTMIRWNWKLEG